MPRTSDSSSDSSSDSTSTSGLQRQRLDTLALTFGLLAVAVSGLALAARAHAFEVDGLVVLATFWVILGAVGLTRVVHRLVVTRDEDAA